MSQMKLNNFIRAVLFGQKDFQLPFDIKLHQLFIDLDKYIDVESTIRNGGVLLEPYVIAKDLENVLRYLEKGNQYFYDGLGEKNSVLKLQSSTINNFFNELSSICKGNLEFGATANTFTPPQLSKQERKTLDTLLREKIPILKPLDIPKSKLNDFLKLYDIKCHSMGKIIDPFSLVLAPQQSYVDSIHWESEQTLKKFIQNFPQNQLSIIIKKLLYSSIMSILDAKEELLPKAILTEENQIIKFIQNVKAIDRNIEKVQDSNTPPTLIDLFHRLLAMVKLDKMWIAENLPTLEKEDVFILNLYIKNVELENENKLLRNMICIKKI